MLACTALLVHVQLPSIRSPRTRCLSSASSATRPRVPIPPADDHPGRSVRGIDKPPGSLVVAPSAVRASRGPVPRRLWPAGRHVVRASSSWPAPAAHLAHRRSRARAPRPVAFSSATSSSLRTFRPLSFRGLPSSAPRRASRADGSPLSSRRVGTADSRTARLRPVLRSISTSAGRQSRRALAAFISRPQLASPLDPRALCRRSPPRRSARRATLPVPSTPPPPPPPTPPWIW